MRVGTIIDDARSLIVEHQAAVERIKQIEAELADLAERGVYRASQYLDQLPFTAAEERAANVALLRQMSDAKSALAATSLDRWEAEELSAAADALHIAANRIERGEA